MAVGLLRTLHRRLALDRAAREALVAPGRVASREGGQAVLGEVLVDLGQALDELGLERVPCETEGSDNGRGKGSANRDVHIFGSW